MELKDTKYKVATAEVLGQQAFVNGKPRIPWNDPAFRELIRDIPIGQGADKIGLGWLRGWDNANLAGDRQ